MSAIVHDVTTCVRKKKKLGQRITDFQKLTDRKKERRDYIRVISNVERTTSPPTQNKEMREQLLVVRVTDQV